MKIEVGESLFYSWLRHVKSCQIVQTNWKPSKQWELLHEEEIEELFGAVSSHFKEAYGYEVFKQNHSVSQLVTQCECDVIGIAPEEDGNRYYAAEVAFHESGLNYGRSKEEAVAKVLSKFGRIAMCLLGYMNTRSAEIIFASPKVNPAVETLLVPAIEDLNALFSDREFDYRFRLIANDDFEEMVLRPILLVSDGVADTAELFMRSYQLFGMFANTHPRSSSRTRKARTTSSNEPLPEIDYGAYGEIKVGQLANVVLRRMLEEGAATAEEVELLQDPDYSRNTFDLNYPLLVRTDAEFEHVRYYVKPLTIAGAQYRMCSQWFEVPANNDKPYLVAWIERHDGNAQETNGAVDPKNARDAREDAAIPEQS